MSWFEDRKKRKQEEEVERKADVEKIHKLKKEFFERSYTAEEMRLTLKTINREIEQRQEVKRSGDNIDPVISLMNSGALGSGEKAFLTGIMAISGVQLSEFTIFTLEELYRCKDFLEEKLANPPKQPQTPKEQQKPKEFDVKKFLDQKCAARTTIKDAEKELKEKGFEPHEIESTIAELKHRIKLEVERGNY